QLIQELLPMATEDVSKSLLNEIETIDDDTLKNHPAVSDMVTILTMFAAQLKEKKNVQGFEPVNKTFERWELCLKVLLVVLDHRKIEQETCIIEKSLNLKCIVVVSSVFLTHHLLMMNYLRKNKDD
ncbi:unnamed protein product, partial [Didymodactylos carnosus]